MDVTSLKRSQLERIASHRDYLRTNPHLRWLFFEITNRCNLRCRHCGSSCTASGQLLTIDDVEATLQSVRTHLTQSEWPMVCLTGGEPLLHPCFFDIARCVQSMGFSWGMTTNATLIDKEFALRLRQVGMSTVSVSLDGMERSHDSLRQREGSWRLALRGLGHLQEAGFEPQVTTVLHQGNVVELEQLYNLLSDMGITSWRPVNVEPIGRACESEDILLRPEQFALLLSYIRHKRFDHTCPMEVTFGCSHYLGVDYERMTRDHYFLCGAGTLTASVRSNGDICGCLDIANRQELVQGNIRQDDFMDVWEHRFQAFRRDRTSGCETCEGCSDRLLCGGDSMHRWDFERNEPMFCYHHYREYLL